jgi:hypothetical protein
VAARPRCLRRWRRRCRPAVAAVTVGAGKMQVTVMVCSVADHHASLLSTLHATFI